VGTHGYAQVFTTIGVIFAFGLVIGALVGGVDWLVRFLSRGGRPRTPGSCRR